MDELPMICRPWNVDEVVARLLAPYLNHPGLEIPEDGVFPMTDSESEFNDKIDEWIDEWLDEGSQYR